MKARKTTKKTAKKVAGLAKSAETAATRRAKELIELIARRMQRITEEGAKTATVQSAKHAGNWVLTITLPLAHADLVTP